MQWPIDSKGHKAPDKTKAETAKSSADEKPAGRITHDERGNAVWRSGSGDSTSTMLRKLEVPELKFEGQEGHKAAPLNPKPVAAKPATPPPVDPGGGYNPYDQRVAAKKPTTPKAPVKKKP